MRLIIDGTAYDTDTSDYIASGNHGDDAPSQASWSLYKAPTGAFFEVAAGHDGVFEELVPLSSREARRWLERNANHLVEKHFGRMPEPTPQDDAPRFSRRTVSAAARLIGWKNSHGTFSAMLRDLGPTYAREVRDEPASMDKRINDLVDLLDNEPNRRLPDGDRLRDRLVELASRYVDDHTPWSGEEPRNIAELRAALDRDGYRIKAKALRRTLPAEAGLSQAEDELTRLLKAHGLATPLGHLQQALDAHSRRDWAAANSQIRTFMESMLDEITDRLDPSAATIASGHAKRSRLFSIGFFSRDLNEWSGDGKGYFEGFMRRLHPQGSHPGLSDEVDSSYRLHSTLLAAALLLSRFDTWPRP